MYICNWKLCTVENKNKYLYFWTLEMPDGFICLNLLHQTEQGRTAHWNKSLRLLGGDKAQQIWEQTGERTTARTLINHLKCLVHTTRLTSYWMEAQKYKHFIFQPAVLSKAAKKYIYTYSYIKLLLILLFYIFFKESCLQYFVDFEAQMSRESSPFWGQAMLPSYFEQNPCT